MILEVASRFRTCYRKFLTARGRSQFIITWTWLLSSLVVFIIVLFVKRCCKCLLINELMSNILNKFKQYICRPRLLLHLENLSFWFRHCIFLITFTHYFRMYSILDKSLSSLIFIIKATFKFSWYWFAHSPLNAIIKAWHFQVCISYMKIEIRDG